MASAAMTEDDRHRIVSLFEVTQRAAQEGADQHVKNEGANAITALFRLLAKYGLDLGDIPGLQRQQDQADAAKATKTGATAPAADRNQLNVLALTHHVLQGYVDLQPHEYVGTALWVLHTHVFEHFQISPRLAALSPIRGCGKSLLFKLLARLVARAELHDNITAPSIYRLIDQGTAPTLLLDEADNLGLRIDRVMRSVLNSGHMRGGVITRVIRNEPKSFSTYAPAAIAAIGTLTLPLLSRSIVNNLHRTLRADLKSVEALSSAEETQRLEGLRRLIVTWAQTAQFDLNPKLPKILRGRTADNWRVLIAVADSFGSTHWSKAAREAAIVYANGFYDEDAVVALLFDIRMIFRQLNTDRVKSAVLVTELHELEDGIGIWGAWRGESDEQAPHAITPSEVAALLRRLDRVELRAKPLFELGSRKTRGKPGRGFYKHQFERWWQIYCPEDSDAPDNVRQLHMKAE